MAAAEEQRPGEGEEEAVSATTKACARGGGGESRAGWERAREPGCGRHRGPHGRLTCLLLEVGEGAGGCKGACLQPNCRFVIRVGKSSSCLRVTSPHLRLESRT